MRCFLHDRLSATEGAVPRRFMTSFAPKFRRNSGFEPCRFLPKNLFLPGQKSMWRANLHHGSAKAREAHLLLPCGTAYMLSRCSAAFLLILVLVLGFAIADQRPASIADEAGLESEFGVAALVSTQVVVSAQIDEQEVRQSSPPAVTQPRSTSGEPGKSSLHEKPSDWRCLTEACLVVADRYDAAFRLSRSTTRSATGPPVTTA